MLVDAWIAGLPGEVIVREGLADYKAGRRTIPACLIAIARPRLLAAGLLPAVPAGPASESELELYQLLLQQRGDAYSRYNALLRELVSFECGLDRRGRGRRSEDGRHLGGKLV